MEGFNRQILRCSLIGVLSCLIIAASASAQVRSNRIEIKPRNQAPAEVKAPGPVAPNLPAAQPQPPQGAPVKTTIEIDITSTSQVGDPAAQNWGRLFEELGYSTRIRVARDAKPGVTEKQRGTLRLVTVSGLLGSRSELIVGEKSFQLDDKVALSEWLDTLKLYGAQGSPEGQPLWGLNRAQFVLVNEQLSQILTVESQGKTADEFLSAVSESGLPVQIPSDTATWLKAGPGQVKLRTDVTGFSRGTALAIAMNELGAGMRPVRTPDGQIEYEIRPFDQIKDAWPLGWSPKEEIARDRITPHLFEQGVVGFENTTLAEVLSAIATESHTPIVVDSRRCLEKKVDVQQVKVSFPQRKIAWALVISQCVRQAKLYNYYRQDEAGRGFVLVAPFEPQQLQLK